MVVGFGGYEEIQIGLPSGLHPGQGASAEDGQRVVTDHSALIEGLAHGIKACPGLPVSLGQSGMAVEGVEA